MSRNARLAGALCCLVALLPAGCDGNGPAPPEETTLGVAFVRSAVESSLRGTAVHLNNYGSEGEERAKSWHRSDDAFIRLSPALGGAEIRFDIPESRTDRGPFRFLYYVNDLNVLADSIAVAVEDDPQELRLVVRLPFEEDGTEFKGHCLDTSFLGGGCLGSKDRAAPDVHLRRARLALTLRPVLVGGGLSLEATEARFEGEIQAGGVCNVNLGFVAFDVCEALAGYEGSIRDEMETTVLAEVNRADVRAHLAAGIRPLLDALGVGEVVFVYRSGDALVVGHHRRP